LTEFIHTSAPGLTSETTRDPITGAMIAKPGILATYSMACFTDMNAAVQHSDGKKLLLSMNHALENKVATSGKAGGAQSFVARSAVLIDSNNYAASWYYDESIAQNLDFAPRSTLSRFDLGAIVPKEMTEEQYEEIGGANYDSYAENEIALKSHMADWTDAITGAPRLGFESLRKFFFYISSQPLPRLPKEDQDMRQYFKRNYAYVATHDLELLVDGRYNRTALILARVRARLLMKEKADSSDLKYAIMFVNKWKNVETLDPKTGEKDANYLVGSQTKREIEILETDNMAELNNFRQGCQEASEQSEDGYFTKMQLADILQKQKGAKKWLDRDQVATAVERALREGKLMEDGRGRYRSLF
jgi:DNA replicative helicase MCM subunit Mcm2 (Cdc46/Mcm family)